MNGLVFAENAKVLPLLAPVDIAATATASKYIHVDNLNWLTFVVSFGAMTSDSTDVATVTVECSTESGSNATEAAVAFNYRQTAAVDTDSLGAITAATSAGCTAQDATDDGKVLIIDIDPAALPAASGLTDPRFVRVVITPNSEMASCIVGVMAIAQTRFPGNSIPSST